MTIEQFNNTRWGAGMRVHCNPMGMRYEPYVADVAGVDFDQSLIGVKKDLESETEELSWFRCENCEIVAELKP